MAVDRYIVLFNVRHPDVRDEPPAVNEQPILLTFLPFFHVYGIISAAVIALAGGMQVVHLPRFLPKQVLSCIEKYKVNQLPI